MPDASAPQTTTSSASQITETLTPSRRITLEQLLREQGNSGVFIINGFLEGDYNSDLTGKVGLDVYDKMRKSDATVSTLLNAVQLPIRSTEWYIEPAKNAQGEITEVEEETADFVHRALFEKMEQSWDDFLREAMGCLWAGYSVCEKVFTMDDDHVWIKKLPFRKQATILRWAQSDGSAGITQITPTPKPQDDSDHPDVKYWIDIPASKLLIFTHQREGDNYEGISLLRPAYKHWYIKDNLYKFDSVRHERQSVGVPYIKLPITATADDYAQAKVILADLRANELTGIVMPNPAWEFGFCDLRAGDVSDIWTTINHHNREILKVGLAQHLELGGGSKGSSGSRAVSSDQSGLMLQSNDAVAKMLEETISRFLIPELVDMNFDGVYRYPTLRHKRLEKLEFAQVGTIIQQAVASGVITPDPAFEAWFRQFMDMPPKVDKTQDNTPDEPQDEQPEEEVPLPIGNAVVDTTQLPGAQGEAADAQQSGQGEETQDAADAGSDDEEETQAAEPIFATATFYEFDGGIIGEVNGEFYDHDGTQFRAPVSEETKAKISAALKARGHGGAAPASKTAPKLAQRAGQLARNKTVGASKSSGAAKTPSAKPNVTKAPQKGESAGALKQHIQQRLENRVKAQLTASGKKTDPASLAKAVGKAKGAVAKNAAKSDKLAKKEVDKKAKDTAKAAKKAAKGSKGKKSKGAKHVKAPKAVKVHAVKTAKVPGKKAAKLSTGAGAGSVPGGPKAIHAHEHITALPMSEEIKAMQWAMFPETFSEAKLPPDRERRRFAEFAEPYKSWRPLTFAEQKVNLASLKAALQKANAATQVKLEQIAEDMKSDLLTQVKNAVKAGDIAAVGKLKAKFTGDLSTELSNVQKQMFDVGMQSAAQEMAIKLPPTAPGIKGVMKVQNDKLVQKMARDMADAASSAVTQAAVKNGGLLDNTGAAEAVAAASNSIDGVLDTAPMRTLSVIGSLNLGRATVFERYPEQVYAFQYSAIIDEVTTDLCLSLDGRVVDAGSDEYYDFSPPQHENCRSIWVEILQDEEFKPEIDGIPGSIEPSKTLDDFEDLEAPVIKSNSPAIGVLQDELDDRQAKLEQYQNAGSYPNRQEAHSDRIDALKSALEDAGVDVSDDEE